NFKLTGDGEYLALVQPDGTTICHAYDPSYPEQFDDWSYGLNTNQTGFLFFTNATPGAANVGGTAGVAPIPAFSFPSGFYTNAFALSLSTTSGVIRYTIDSSEPNGSSPLYAAPLNIQSRIGDSNYFSLFVTTTNPFAWLPPWNPPAGEVFKATVVRARTFEAGKAPSPIVTRTYFVDTNIWQRYSTLPVVSIVSDEEHLFSDATGIYVPGDTGNNYGQGWERPAHISLIETNGEIGFQQDLGIRIQGSTSIRSPHKGLLVFARSEYGDADLDYRLFPGARSKAGRLTEFKRFMIRAWSSFRGRAFIYDTYTQQLLAEHDLDIQDYRPCVVFINGEYWGLQEIRESSKNPFYYESHYDIDRDDPGVDILLGGGNTVDEGDSVHWDNMLAYIAANDMSQPEHYAYIQAQLDTENFMLYIM
ncbi:MAG: FN3 associated domain-containing protein, partial [Verrucomicrobiota bacterium]